MKNMFKKRENYIYQMHDGRYLDLGRWIAEDDAKYAAKIAGFVLIVSIVVIAYVYSIA